MKSMSVKQQRKLGAMGILTDKQNPHAFLTVSKKDYQNKLDHEKKVKRMKEIDYARSLRVRDAVNDLEQKHGHTIILGVKPLDKKEFKEYLYLDEQEMMLHREENLTGKKGKRLRTLENRIPYNLVNDIHGLQSSGLMADNLSDEKMLKAFTEKEHFSADSKDEYQKMKSDYHKKYDKLGMKR